jgi:hypothetical protein
MGAAPPTHSDAGGPGFQAAGAFPRREPTGRVPRLSANERGGSQPAGRPDNLRKSFPLARTALDPENPLHRALARLRKGIRSEKGAAPNGATKSHSM